MVVNWHLTPLTVSFCHQKRSHRCLQTKKQFISLYTDWFSCTYLSHDSYQLCWVKVKSCFFQDTWSQFEDIFKRLHMLHFRKAVYTQRNAFIILFCIQTPTIGYCCSQNQFAKQNQGQFCSLGFAGIDSDSNIMNNEWQEQWHSGQGGHLSKKVLGSIHLLNVETFNMECTVYTFPV